MIPALNEALNLPHVLPLIPSWVYEVILVDGLSTDGTPEVARELWPDIVIVAQDGPGKGSALRTGLSAAAGEIVVMLDADGSTDPREIPAFVDALLDGADFVKGSRFMSGGGTEDMPFYRKAGNAAFVVAVRMLFGSRFTDLCYGYNACWARALPHLQLDATGFEIETQMSLRAVWAGLRITEVPSFEANRVNGASNLRTIPDGWRVLKQIWRERFRSPITRGSVVNGHGVGVPVMQDRLAMDGARSGRPFIGLDGAKVAGRRDGLAAHPVESIGNRHETLATWIRRPAPAGIGTTSRLDVRRVQPAVVLIDED